MLRDAEMQHETGTGKISTTRAVLFPLALTEDGTGTRGRKEKKSPKKGCREMERWTEPKESPLPPATQLLMDAEPDARW